MQSRYAIPLVAVSAAAAAWALLAPWPASAPANADASAKPALSRAAMVKRGEHLTRIGACFDCHTPWKMGENGPEPDKDRWLSGHPETFAIAKPPATPAFPWVATVAATNTAWAGPWGVSFTANLTPDNETGLGSWTPEMFRETIRNGRHMGRGRPLLPPMPWPAYLHHPDEDLDAIFAYLQSLPPIRNRVPEPLPPAAAPDAGAAPATPSGG